VVYGRRLLDGVFLFEADKLRNPHRYYPAIVDTLHRQQLGALAYWWQSRKAALMQDFRSRVRRLCARR
jgi:hypothetical protein